MTKQHLVQEWNTYEHFWNDLEQATSIRHAEGIVSDVIHHRKQNPLMSITVEGVKVVTAQNADGRIARYRIHV